MNSNDALICALASEAIYNSQDAVEAILRPLGFESFTFIQFDSIADDICAIVASSDAANLICFRGTKVFQNWLTDLHASPVRFEWIFSGGPTIGEIHSGFGNCLESRLLAIFGAFASSRSKPLLITGHSLGGALAAILGACFTVCSPSLSPVTGIYTFGQPRVGLHNFCGTYDQILKGKLVRFVNNLDIVPRIPFRGFDYGDEGQMIHFDSTGIALAASDEWASFLSRTFQSFADFGQMLFHLGDDVNDHNMSTYRGRVDDNQVRVDDILTQNNLYSGPIIQEA
jgi:triacylglycerol lipase